MKWKNNLRDLGFHMDGQTDRRTDIHGYIDLAVDAEYIQFVAQCNNTLLPYG